MGCQEPNDDKASKTPNEALYNTENILVDINEKRITILLTYIYLFE